MTNIAEQTLASIVTTNNSAVQVLEKHNLDFCCKGKRTHVLFLYRKYPQFCRDFLTKIHEFPISILMFCCTIVLSIGATACRSFILYRTVASTEGDP